MQNRKVIQILKALCHVSVDVLKGYPAPPLGRDGDDPCRGGAEQQPSWKCGYPIIWMKDIVSTRLGMTEFGL